MIRASQTARADERPSAHARARVMSCRSTVVVTADDTRVAAEIARRAVDRCAGLERSWSRFLPDSDITLLNRAGGAPVRVGTDTVRLVTALVQAWIATDGAFDPTLLHALVGLGYAASRDDATLRTSLADGSTRGRPDAILVDPESAVVQLPAGTTLDAGGLGKGLAADIAATEAVADGAVGALVEIGGDLRVIGTSPTSDRWAVAIEPARAGEPTRIVDLLDGAIATSSSMLRTWRQDGVERHHLLDPRTLAPTSNDTVSCTVVAGTGVWAEAFTKVAFADGAESALHRFEERALAASITTADGALHTTPAWKEFCR